MASEASETSISILDPAALIAIDVWSDFDTVTARLADALNQAPPALGQSTALDGAWRALRLEPTVWWLVGPLEDLDARLTLLAAALGDDGAATDLSGGFDRLSIRGDWREILMFGGVFDAESPAFAIDCTVGTVLHHVAVRYDVIDENEVLVFVAPSYAADLLHHLRATVPGL